VLGLRLPLLLLMMLGLLRRWVLRWRRLLMLLPLLRMLPLQGLHSWYLLLLPFCLRQAPAPAAAARCRCCCFSHCRSRILLVLLPGLRPRFIGRWVLPPVPVLLLLAGVWGRRVHCRTQMLLLRLLGAVPGRRRRNLLHWLGLSCHPTVQAGLTDRLAGQPGWLANRLAWWRRGGPLPAAAMLPGRVLPPALGAGP
jgi:hypothetical protein